MGRKKKEVIEQIATDVPHVCGHCNNLDEDLFCPEQGEHMGKADSCSEWTPKGTAEETKHADVEAQSGECVDIGEDIDKGCDHCLPCGGQITKTCGNCAKSVDSPESTDENPQVYCLTAETDAPRDEPGCEDWQESSNGEPKTCGNCNWGGVKPNPHCAQGVVEPEDFDQNCPACDQWLSQVQEEDSELFDYDKSLSGNPLTSEMPGSRPTTDFCLYKFPNFEHELSIALLEAYRYIGKGGEGDPSVTIKLTGFRDTIKAGIIVDLPHKIKLSVGSVETVRENGEFRIVLKPEQVGLFEYPMPTTTESAERIPTDEATEAEEVLEQGEMEPDTDPESEGKAAENEIPEL